MTIVVLVLVSSSGRETPPRRSRRARRPVRARGALTIRFDIYPYGVYGGAHGRDHRLGAGARAATIAWQRSPGRCPPSRESRLVEVDLEAKLTVVRGASLDDAAIRAAIDEAGYEAGMSGALRLALFAAVTAAVFGGAWAVGNAAGPISTAPGDGGGHEPAMAMADGAVEVSCGPSVASDGVSARRCHRRTLRPGATQQFAFRIVRDDGTPLRDYELEHERLLHLIVVGRDLTGFQHLHPRLLRRRRRLARHCGAACPGGVSRRSPTSSPAARSTRSASTCSSPARPCGRLCRTERPTACGSRRPPCTRETRRCFASL